MTARIVAPGTVTVAPRRIPPPVARLLPDYGRNELVKAGHSQDPERIDRAIGLCKTLYPNLFK